MKKPTKKMKNSIPRKVKFKIREKKIKFGKLRIRISKMPHCSTIMLNFGRYKRRRKVDTWTLYSGIAEKHKPLHDEVWLDIQDKQAIGMTITLDNDYKAKRRKASK